MLEEMNPTKVLELQDKVDGVENEQNNIFNMSVKESLDNFQKGGTLGST